MDEILQALLAEVKSSYKQHGTLTNEILSVLQGVVPGPLLPALDLVDQQAVTRFHCSSGRQAYQVIGSSGTPYTCHDCALYCSCPAYKFSVLTKGDSSLCKHLLAIQLSVAMEMGKSQEVTDTEMVHILAGID